ncbi:hypothetical protein [Prauserella cavernicola]|uniref:Uncharacterized protein n=1 Tax=Prauserella cavernicola TaxID=2800127 RepID=A0A934QNV3_9PSEU|nr:hypothetical protein [Prauserella cavernicola]MBK1784071.1 hypothetical protein [Prauserella cavernicola]
MGHVVEQRPDGQPGPDEGRAAEPAPGSDLQPVQPAHPVEPVQPPQQPQEPDPEQLRQFQQFQQFQEFLKFQQSQQQGGELVPGQQQQPVPHTQHHPAPAATQQLVQQPPQPPQRPKVPGWLRWLGKKIIGWLIFFLLLALALTWAYNHFFGSDEGDSTESAAKMGGGTYRTNELLSDEPYEAVRQVYDAIAQVDPTTDEPLVAEACGRFDEPVQQSFGEHLGYRDCRQAVLALNKEVTHVNDYAESIYPQPYGGGATTVRIDSCDFAIKGGPALGTFIVTKQDYADQWLITGHERGPVTCSPPTSN